MDTSQCENCQTVVTEADGSCRFCGYPQHGSKQEKIRYNAKLILLKNTLEDSAKSVKAMISFSIIFLFASLVTGLFSLFFHENHYQNVLLFGFIAGIYFMLNKLGKRSAYMMAALALIFYLAHTIFEFENGIYLKSSEDLSKSFVESKGAAVIFALIPLAYIFFRVSLIIVLARILLIELKLKKHAKQIRFLKRKAAEPK